MLDLIENTHGEGMTLLAVEDEETRFRQHQLGLGERTVPVELSNEPREIVRMPRGGFGIDDGLVLEWPHDRIFPVAKYLVRLSARCDRT